MKNTIEPIYPFIKKNRFYNHKNDIQEGFLFRSLAMIIKSLLVRYRDKVDKIDWFLKNDIRVYSDYPSVTWIGHATFLIQIGNINILTDPIFGHASLMFKRVLPPGISLSSLPRIDLILLSHNHFDHMELSSVRFLQKRDNAQIFVPKGDKYWLSRYCKGSAIREFSWGESGAIIGQKNVSAQAQCTFLPAAHWSQRGVLDKNKSLWGSWMIDVGSYQIYFAGDTAYSSHFKHIGRSFPSIDVALMPIGPCEPHKWMKSSHMNAEEAGQAFIDLNAQHFIPMHWGTFYFGTDKFDLPVKRLDSWWQKNSGQIPHSSLLLLKTGQRHTF